MNQITRNKRCLISQPIQTTYSLTFLIHFTLRYVRNWKNTMVANGWKRVSRKHFKRGNFDRIEEMLSSPMRVVDMKREESGLELYGVEHLWQIVNGSWKGLFESIFRNRVRTEACLGEITEVRHNLAHRHKHHVVLRSSLVRFVQNCRMLLVALETQDSDTFTRD